MKQVGPSTWARAGPGAVEFTALHTWVMRRRVTRDALNGLLFEDLWLSEMTPERVVKKQLRLPRDLATTTEVVDSVGLEEERDAVVAWDDAPMEPSQATQYRALVARLNFLSLDRPDLQFCCKEASRKKCLSQLTVIGECLSASPATCLGGLEWCICTYGMPHPAS